jgi:amino acid permease
MADFEKQPIEENGKEVLDHHNGYVPEGRDEEVGIVNKAEPLARQLRGRHMQMIAIGMRTSSTRWCSLEQAKSNRM